MLLFRRTRRVIVEPYSCGWSVWTHLKESFVGLKKELVTSRGVSDIEQLLCFGNRFSQQHFHLVIFDVLRIPFGSQMFPQVFGKLHRDHSKSVVNQNSLREGQQVMHECCETTKNVASTSVVMLVIPLSFSWNDYDKLTRDKPRVLRTMKNSNNRSCLHWSLFSVKLAEDENRCRLIWSVLLKIRKWAFLNTIRSFSSFAIGFHSTLNRSLCGCCQHKRALPTVAEQSLRSYWNLK